MRHKASTMREYSNNSRCSRCNNSRCSRAMADSHSNKCKLSRRRREDGPVLAVSLTKVSSAKIAVLKSLKGHLFTVAISADGNLPTRIIRLNSVRSVEILLMIRIWHKGVKSFVGDARI